MGYFYLVLHFVQLHFTTNQWKKLRQIADTTLRHGAIKAKWQLGDEGSKEFYQWLREKVYPLRQSDGTYPFATDIIALRNRFFEDKSESDFC